jgi:hypothetical protein
MSGERVESGNHGMLRMASGDVVGYFDADMILSPLLLETAYDFFTFEDCVGVHIPEIILGKNLLSKARRLERTFYNGTIIDAARLIRSDILHKVSGFDLISFPTPSAEDWDLDKRIKAYGKIYTLPSIKVPRESIKTIWDPCLLKLVSCNVENQYINCPGFFHNEVSFTLRWYLNKKRYYSTTLTNYINKWGGNDEDIKKQLGIKYRLFVVFIENGKWRKILKSPTLFMILYFMIISVGLVYTINKEPRTSKC